MIRLESFHSPTRRVGLSGPVRAPSPAACASDPRPPISTFSRHPSDAVAVGQRAALDPSNEHPDRCVNADASGVAGFKQVSVPLDAESTRRFPAKISLEQFFRLCGISQERRMGMPKKDSVRGLHRQAVAPLPDGPLA